MTLDMSSAFPNQAKARVLNFRLPLDMGKDNKEILIRTTKDGRG